MYVRITKLKAECPNQYEDNLCRDKNVFLFRETGMTKVVELRDIEELTDDYLRFVVSEHVLHLVLKIQLPNKFY